MVLHEVVLRQHFGFLFAAATVSAHGIDADLAPPVEVVLEAVDDEAHVTITDHGREVVVKLSLFASQPFLAQVRGCRAMR